MNSARSASSIALISRRGTTLSSLCRSLEGRMLLLPRLALERRREHIAGYRNVPDLRLRTTQMLLEAYFDLIEIRDPCPPEREALCNAGKIGASEPHLLVGNAIHPQLVDLRSIGAVVQRDDQHLNVVSCNRLQLLDMHDQTAVAVDEQHSAIIACDRNPDCVGQTGADGAEVANARVQLRRPPLRVRCGEIGAVAAAADQEPVLGDDTIDLLHGAAGVDGAVRKLVRYRDPRFEPACGLRRPIADLVADLGWRRPLQAFVDGGNPKPRIGAPLRLSDCAIVTHGARTGVDLDDPRLRVELAKMRGEASQACADRDDEVSLGEQLSRHVARPAATNANRKGLAVEQPARRKRRGEQSAAAL